MAIRSVVEYARQHVARQLKIRSPLVVDHMQRTDPERGLIHRVVVVDPANANGSTHPVFVDDQGKVLTSTPTLALMFDQTAAASAALSGRLALNMAPVTVDPSVNAQSGIADLGYARRAVNRGAWSSALGSLKRFIEMSAPAPLNCFHRFARTENFICSAPSFPQLLSLDF
jgi:hypothetical protein